MTATPTDCKMKGFQLPICFLLSLDAGMLFSLFVVELKIRRKQGLPTQARNYHSAATSNTQPNLKGSSVGHHLRQFSFCCLQQRCQLRSLILTHPLEDCIHSSSIQNGIQCLTYV